MGQRYFESRNRLLECRKGIEALARECGVPERKDEAEAWAALERPLQFAVLGEVNAGKSTLINVLAGGEVSPAGLLPMTREITRYRFGRRGATLPREDGWPVVAASAPSLRRIEWIDTPGSNGDDRDKVVADLDRVAAADLLLVVFPADNTWTAATWGLLERLTEEALRRTILVVQQADRKSDADLRVIRGHMRDLAVKKTGVELPWVAVSAKQVLRGARDEGFAALGEWISQEICRSPERQHRLRWLCQDAGRRLREIEEALEAQRRGMDDDGWFLSGLEREAEKLRDLILEVSPKTLAGARGRYENEVARLARGLASQLGPARSFWRLLGGDRTSIEVEAVFAERLQEAVRDFSRADVERLLEECEGHWGEVRPRVLERMKLDPGEVPLSGEQRERVVADFAAQMDKAVGAILNQLRVRAVLDGPLRRRNAQLKAWAVLALSLISAAGICGTLRLDDPAVGLLGGGALAGVLGWLAAVVTGRRVVGLVRERLSDARGRFEAAMREDYTAAVRGLFREYSNGLMEVRRGLADRRATLEPRSRNWSEWFLRLKAVEQEVG